MIYFEGFFHAVSTFFTRSVLCLRQSVILHELLISRRVYLFYSKYFTFFMQCLLFSRSVNFLRSHIYVHIHFHSIYLFHGESTNLAQISLLFFMQYLLFSRCQFYVDDNLSFYLSYLFHGEATYFTQSSFIFSRSVYVVHAVSSFFTQSHLCLR